MRYFTELGLAVSVVHFKAVGVPERKNRVVWRTIERVLQGPSYQGHISAAPYQFALYGLGWEEAGLLHRQCVWVVDR